MSLSERDAKVVAGVEMLRFFPLEVSGGSGSIVRTPDGRELIDLSASWGAASLGYGHPAIVEAVSRAAGDMASASILSSINEPAVRLAERLLEITPARGERRVWFGHSGSDANEAALRCAMRATGRERIIAFEGAYHGGTVGSMSISGHPSQKGQGRLPGLAQLAYPDPYRAVPRRPSEPSPRSTSCWRDRVHLTKSRRSGWSRSCPTSGSSFRLPDSWRRSPSVAEPMTSSSRATR